MNRINRNCAGMLAIAVGSLAQPAYAHAESTQPSAGEVQAQQVAAANPEDDIVVTARHRNERRQDVPVAVTAFSGPELARYNTDSLPQLSARTPTLMIIPTGNPTGGHIALRGVGTGSSGPQLDQPVSVNIDGAQVSQANVINLGFYDIERIEVLSGPQTLFFGKNSPGGIISIVSASPGDHFEARLRTGYEFSNQSKFVEAMVSGPLSDSVGFRFSGYVSDQQGWFRDIDGLEPAHAIPASLGGGSTSPTNPESRTGPNGQTYFGRATLAYRPAGGVFDATLKAAFGRQNFDNSVTYTSQIINCPGGRPQYSISVGQTGSDCTLDRYVHHGLSTIGAPPQLLFPDGQARNDQTQFLGTLTANLRPSDELTLTSVSSFYHMTAAATADNVYTGLDYFRTEWTEDQKQYTQELRLLTSFHSPLNVMLGAYYQHFDNYQRNTIPTSTIGTFVFTAGAVSGPTLLGNNSALLKTNAYSLYGQIIVDIVPKLQLTVGGRYSHESKAVSAHNFPYSLVPTDFDFPIAPNRRTFNNFSPDVTLTYKPSSTLTLYGAYRRGFLSGGFDIGNAAMAFGRRSIGDISYAEETVEGGEVGIRGSLADRQISFDLTAYDYKYRGLQVSAFDAATLSNRLTNAGSANVRGAELALQARPNAAPGLTLHGTLAYNPARYGSFRNSPCYTGQSQAAGCNLVASRGADGSLVVTPVAAGAVANAQDLSGRPLVRNSDWSGSVGASYDQAVSHGMRLSLSADAVYTGHYFAGGLDEPASYQSAAWRLNGRIALGSRNDHWELALIGVNLTNELRAQQSYVIPATGGGTGRTTGFNGDEAGVPSAPRTITLQATFRY